MRPAELRNRRASRPGGGPPSRRGEARGADGLVRWRHGATNLAEDRRVSLGSGELGS
jgi:hypothetical protein